jgi:hypothetical protein
MRWDTNVSEEYAASIFWYRIVVRQNSKVSEALDISVFGATGPRLEGKNQFVFELVYFYGFISSEVKLLNRNRPLD